MSFEHRHSLVLVCDNGCGAEEDAYEHVEPNLPDGWVKDYDNGDSVFRHACLDCVKESEEEKDNATIA